MSTLMVITGKRYEAWDANWPISRVILSLEGSPTICDCQKFVGYTSRSRRLVQAGCFIRGD